LPMPRPAPVMIATLSCKTPDISASLNSFELL
jgi:hypothetical protein